MKVHGMSKHDQPSCSLCHNRKEPLLLYTLDPDEARTEQKRTAAFLVGLSPSMWRQISSIKYKTILVRSLHAPGLPS